MCSSSAPFPLHHCTGLPMAKSIPAQTDAWLDKFHNWGLQNPWIRCFVLQAISDVVAVPWLITHLMSEQWRHERGVRGLNAERRMRCKSLKKRHTTVELRVAWLNGTTLKLKTIWIDERDARQRHKTKSLFPVSNSRTLLAVCPVSLTPVGPWVSAGRCW